MEKDIIKDAINEMLFGITDEEYENIEIIADNKINDEEDKKEEGE